MEVVSLKIIRSDLSPREKQVLKLICNEKTTNEISKRLGITSYGVEFHRRNIYLKTKSKSIVGLVKYSIKAGICKI